MPINKDKERFLQNKIPYEMISREVVQSLSNPDALAIWVYLMAKPPTWIVRREDIRSHFSIGRDRYSKAMSELNEAGLVVTKNVQGADGKIVSRSFTVEATLTHMRPDNHSSGKPTQRGLGHCGETDHIDNKRLLREKDSNKRATQFDAWWDVYPKKKDKKTARQRFMKLTEKALTACLADNLKARYKDTDPKFIPMPSTYLSKERWDDEIDDVPCARGGVKEPYL